MSRSYATTRYASTSGGSSKIVPAGVIDGINTVFNWATAPSVIIVDQGRSMQKQNNGGFLTQNWTGTTSTTLLVPPSFDIYGFT